ncbi:embryonic polarity protein dorsal-like, partial [Leptinotarsa decemlineata]|uniref:embryonic polarity protein dorsal-like n=1 Tax=Leptinotarsa decemlineata TaxID=7539 RepID=UPI003D30AFAC
RWSLRRNLAKKGDYNLFNSILAHDAKLVAKRQLGFSEPEKCSDIGWKDTVSPVVEANNNRADAVNQETDYSEIKKLKKEDAVVEEKSFNELIDQVAELDEIYSETQARLLNEALSEVDKPLEAFDDNKTYSSLQMAFKNPVEIDLTQCEPAVCSKRESDADKPPLPPKRTKKIETFIGNSSTSLNKSDLHGSNSTIRGSRLSCTGSLQRPRSQIELSPPLKQLPPTPNYSTLPNPKKRGFFSKLFGRGKDKSASQSRETSVTPSSRSNIFSSNKSLQAENGLERSSRSLLQVDNSLRKSSGNVSTHSSNSIRIPLNPPSAPITNQVTNQVIDDSDDVDMNLDLTEAEHYALYTAIAPHATQSEFDEMSCYYAPVEGGKLLTNAEVLARLASKT